MSEGAKYDPGNAVITLGGVTISGMIDGPLNREPERVTCFDPVSRNVKLVLPEILDRFIAEGGERVRAVHALPVPINCDTESRPGHLWIAADLFQELPGVDICRACFPVH